jgi:iron complex outermembrane recepter protein
MVGGSGLPSRLCRYRPDQRGFAEGRLPKGCDNPRGPLTASRDRPWLLNIAVIANVTRGLSTFGSFTRGLEESEVAPEIAFNRDEAPPALLTNQLHAGLRLAQ